MKKFCYVNGKFTSLEKPQIKANDLGLLRGYAVFDFIKVVDGRPLFWPEHLARFRRSAETLGLACQKSDKAITIIAKKLIIKNRIKQGSLRLFLTGGPTSNGMSLNGKPVFGLLVEDAYNLPATVFTTGGKLMTVEYQRIFPEAKTTNYLLAVQLQSKKNKAGAIEVLYVNKGEILEASTSNFFLVKGKKIVTPKAGVLGGVTREKVIGLAKKLGYKITERAIKISEIKSADEAFITATNKDVAPIVKIDNLKIGAGRPGLATLNLLRLYRQLIKQ